MPDSGDGDGKALGDVGEIPFGVCEVEGPAESGFNDPLSEMLVSDARRVSLPAPMPFFCLNFSSQLELLVFKWPSLPPTVVAQVRARFKIAASVTGKPCF